MNIDYNKPKRKEVALKTMSDELFEKIRKEGLENLEKPEIKEVFIRLRDK